MAAGSGVSANGSAIGWPEPDQGLYRGAARDGEVVVDDGVDVLDLPTLRASYCMASARTVALVGLPVLVDFLTRPEVNPSPLSLMMSQMASWKPAPVTALVGY